MVLRRVLVALAFAALVCANEVEDSEQKKRGAGKSSSLNAIPTGAQKPEYTYSIYPQSQSQSTYQPQQVSSFYPSQANQYYTSGSPQPEQTYPQQPQINLIPPQSSSQFVPLNFVPNPGYQTKFQLVPSRTQGGIQLTLIPQQAVQSPVVYPQQLFNPGVGQVNPPNFLSSLSPQNFNVPNYQLPVGSPFGQSSMLLFSQPNSLYNNLLYQNPNPVQSLYNYYPSSQPSSQPRYVYTPQQTNEVQSPPAQATPKEDNDINTHSTEYISPSDTYKSAYRGPTYSKH